MLNGLRKNANVTAFNLELLEDGQNVELPNLGLFLPNIRHLAIAPNSRQGPTKRPKISTNTFMRDLRALETLKIVDVDVELGNEQEAPFICVFLTFCSSVFRWLNGLALCAVFTSRVAP